MFPEEKFRPIFEDAVGQSRFSMNQLYKGIESTGGKEFATVKSQIERSLGRKATKHVLQGLLRFCFLIEPVLSRGGSTKMNVRWTEELSDDARFSDYPVCVRMFLYLLDGLWEHLGDEANKELLRLFANNNLVAYEIPVDYMERRADNIHTDDNISWVWSDLPSKTVQLRQYLRNNSDHDFAQIFKEPYSKIEVKAYLTDRAQTGLYQTNREKRWESHPLNYQYALRRQCWGVEYKLVSQICYFSGFSVPFRLQLENEGVLEPLETPARCPITMDVLDFDEFRDEVLSPIHGRSKYQVGHLNPLKAENDDPYSGHTSENISWITEDGNRIQGSLTLSETRDLLRRISHNYEHVGLD